MTEVKTDGNPFKIIILLFFLMIITWHVNAQDTAGTPKKGFLHADLDTNYIADYTRLVTARIYGLFQEAGFRNKTDQLDNVSYRPNVPGRLGIGAVYRWLGLGLSLGIPFLKPSEEKYGKTKFYDLRVNAYGNQLAAELFLQNYKGYYLKANDQVYLVPDMRVFSLGIYAYYFYNYKRFSIRAAFLQNERQKKSAGSFAIRPSFIYYKFSSDHGIFPPEFVMSITGNPVEIPVEGHFYSWGLAPGYTYTFVFLKNFYFNIAAYPGFFYQTGKYETDQKLEYNRNGISVSFGIKAAAGYNSDKWFAGCGFSSGIGSWPASVSGNGYYYDITQFRVWGGTRFDWFRKKNK